MNVRLLSGVVLSAVLSACGSPVDTRSPDPDGGGISIDARSETSLLPNEDAGEDAGWLPPPTLSGAFIAVSDNEAVRVTLPSGTITPLWKIQRPTGFHVSGVAKRPDGSLDLLEIEKTSNTTWRTHITQVDKASGAAISAERVLDGFGVGADYAADGKMWIAWNTPGDILHTGIATLDNNGPTIAFNTKMAADVAISGNVTYAMAAEGCFSSSTALPWFGACGEDPAPRRTNLLQWNPPKVDPQSQYGGDWRMAPVAGQLVLVAEDGRIVVFDPTTKSESGLTVPFAFRDATEDSP